MACSAIYSGQILLIMKLDNLTVKFIRKIQRGVAHIYSETRQRLNFLHKTS